MSKLHQHLASRQEAIAEAWRQKMLATLPEGGAGFIGKQKDRFRNPMGATLTVGATDVTRALFERVSKEEMEHRLDDLIHLRAVQGLAPSKSLAFIPELKGVIRDEIGDLNFPEGELAEIDQAIDDILYLAFDMFVRCREQIFELRARSMRDRSYKLMERAGLLWEEEPEKDSGMNRGES